MGSKLRPHLTYANVVSSVCLFVVLGGSAYAAATLSKNSVRSKHIKNGQVKRADIAKNAVTSSKIANSSLVADDFKAGQLPAGPQGPRGAKGDTGSVDTSNLYTKSDSDSRYVRRDAGEGSVWAFGQIREDATIRDGSARLLSVTRPGTGQYCVNLEGSGTEESAVVGLAGSSDEPLFPHITNGQQPFVCPANPNGQTLVIAIYNIAGTPTDGRFSFIVPSL